MTLFNIKFFSPNGIKPGDLEKLTDLIKKPGGLETFENISEIMGNFLGNNKSMFRDNVDTQYIAKKNKFQNYQPTHKINFWDRHLSNLIYQITGTKIDSNNPNCVQGYKLSDRETLEVLQNIRWLLIKKKIKFINEFDDIALKILKSTRETGEISTKISIYLSKFNLN